MFMISMFNIYSTVIISFILTSCAFPAPLSYFNYTRITYDTSQILQRKKTSGSSILSSMINMDCQFLNVIDKKKICKENNNGY